MNIEPGPVIQLLSFVVSVGGALYGWIASRDKATALQIRELDLRFGVFEARTSKAEFDIASRVQAVEARLANVPDFSAIHKLELGMQEVRGAVDQMRDQWTQVQHSIRRMEEYLLDARERDARMTAVQQPGRSGRGRKP